MTLISYKVEWDQRRVMVSALLDRSLVRGGELRYVQLQRAYTEGDMAARDRAIDGLRHELADRYGVAEDKMVQSRHLY